MLIETEDEKHQRRANRYMFQRRMQHLQER